MKEDFDIIDLLLLFVSSRFPPLASRSVGVEHMLVNVTLRAFCAWDNIFRLATIRAGLAKELA